MDAPGTVESAEGQGAGRALRATDGIDALTVGALVALLLGWFFLDTLVVRLGALQHGMRFYDLAAVIADPSRLFLGVDAPLYRLAFGALCLACLLAPLARARYPHPLWSGAYFLPLALMVFGGAMLYSRTSGDFLSSPADSATLTGSVVRFANDLVRRSSGLVAHHVSIGTGAYLAAAAALLLAERGVRRMRRRTARAGG